MLTIYEDGTCKKKIGKKPIKDVESWFNSHIEEIIIDDTVKRIMLHLDKAEFMGHRIIRNESGHITNIAYLSRGAKAVICVYTFPKVVFDFTDIENKAFTYALTLPRGRIIIKIDERGVADGYERGEPDILNKVRVVTWEGTRICESVYETYQYLTWSMAYEVDARSSNMDYYNLCAVRHGIEHPRIESNVPGIVDFDVFFIAALERVTPIEGYGRYYGVVKYPGYKERSQGYVLAWDEPDYEEEYKQRKERMGNHLLDMEKLERKYKKVVAKRLRHMAGGIKGEEVKKC